MQTQTIIQNQSNKLLFFGVLLFLFGLVIGLFIPMLANPRMGLSAHLEGALNGMFLILLGILWPRLNLSPKWLSTTFWVVLYGSFANFLAVAIGAATGAGKLMPIAGGKEGTAITEGVISFLLASLSLAMLFVCVLLLIGLRKSRTEVPNND
jgi:(hydroxyamino)benzene mutase